VILAAPSGAALWMGLWTPTNADFMDILSGSVLGNLFGTDSFRPA